MKAFVIYLPEHEHSVRSSHDTLQSLWSYGIDAELYVGTSGEQGVTRAQKANKIAYPYGIKNRELPWPELLSYIRPEYVEKFNHGYYGKIYERQGIDKNKEKQNSPGVIGCFYSHYGLWQKCLEMDEPIMI